MARRSSVLLLPMLTVALVAPTAASAATVTTGGDGALVVTTGAGATGLDLDREQDGRVRVAARYDDPITSVPASCDVPDDDPYLARCAVGGAGVRVLLGDGNDAVTLHGPLGVPVTIDGGDGDDVLLGALEGGAETLLGGPGDDGLNGRAGDDVVDGGPGDDAVNGGPGADTVLGGEGRDTLLGDDGGAVDADLIDGGPGYDTLDGEYLPVGREGRGPVAVTLDAGADDGVAGERDDLRGLERIQTVAGGRYVGTDGADEVLVGGEATTVEGRGGDDTIFTSYSADVIDGGAGADTIRGYGGADRITGGPGSDTLFGDTADHVCNALTCTIHSGNDVIDARDGERDDVDCGLGTDRALVDALDVHVRCEDVQVGAPATGSVGGVAGGSADGASRPPSRLMVQRRPLRAALARGLVVRLAGARPGRVPVTVRWGRRAVAAGVVKVGSDGRGRATVRFIRRLRPVLAAQRRLTLRVVAGRAVTVVRLSRR